MLAGFIALAIKGSTEVGGYKEVWRICSEGKRIDFTQYDHLFILYFCAIIFFLRVSFDPRYRHTVWSVVVGGTFLWLSVYSVNQSQVQRYLCCRSKNRAKGFVAD